MKTQNYSINMWYRNRFIPKKYHADAYFYPHGCFGYSYCGNIYDNNGKVIGDYEANDSGWIEQNFKLSVIQN